MLVESPNRDVTNSSRSWPCLLRMEPNGHFTLHLIVWTLYSDLNYPEGFIVYLYHCVVSSRELLSLHFPISLCFALRVSAVQSVGERRWVHSEIKLPSLSLQSSSQAAQHAQCTAFTHPHTRAHVHRKATQSVWRSHYGLELYATLCVQSTQSNTQHL